MGIGGNGNSPHGNPMGMGISQKLGNGGGREWKLNRWEWEGMGMLKAIPAHLCSEARYSSRIAILPTPPDSTPPLGGGPSEYRHPVWYGKN